jgi:hypothetical protein
MKMNENQSGSKAILRSSIDKDELIEINNDDELV